MCQCDLATGSWIQTTERYMRVDYLPPFLFGETQVLTHVDNSFLPMQGAFFIYVFNWELWLAIGVLTFIFAFLKLLDRKFSPSGNRFKMSSSIGADLERPQLLLLKTVWFRQFRNAMQATG